MAQELGGGFDAVHAGEPDVHEDEVGIGLLAELDGVGAVLGFADDAKFGAAFQNGLDAIAYQLVVIDKDDVECHSFLSRLRRPARWCRTRDCW